MENKKEDLLLVKYNDNMIEITPSQLKKYLSRREGKTLVRLLLKYNGKSRINKREQYKISILLAKFQLNMLADMEEIKTDKQKKKIEELLFIHNELGKKLRVKSITRKLLFVLSILCMALIIVVANGVFNQTTYTIIFTISLLANLFVALFIIYCKEHVWNWKYMNPITKTIWWSILLINMSFTAKAVLYLWSLIYH